MSRSIICLLSSRLRTWLAGKPSALLFVAACLALGSPRAFAASTDLWTGVTSTNMSTAGNYSPSYTITNSSGNTDIIEFNQSGYTNSPSTTASYTLGALWFTSLDTGGVTIGNGSSNTIILDGTTVNGNVTTGLEIDNGSGAVTIAPTIQLGGNETWINNSTGTLSLQGGLKFNGSQSLTLTGSGNYSISGVINQNSSSNTLAMAGTGTLNLSNGSNSWTGTLTLVTGTVNISGSGVLTAGGSITLNADGGTFVDSSTAATTGDDNFNNGGSVYNRGYTVFQTTSSTSNEIQLGGVSSRSAGAALNAQPATSSGAGSITIGTSVGGSGILPGWITVTNGSGTFWGAGGGGNAITAAAVAAALPTSGAGSSSTNYSVTATGASSSSSSVESANALQITSTSGTLTLNNTLTFTSLSGGLLYSPGATTGNSYTIAGSSANTIGAGSSAEFVVTVANGNTLTVSAPIAGSSSALTKAGTGTLVLAGANTYSGTTFIDSGTLQIGNSGAFGGGGSVTLTGTATLDFAGTTLTNSPAITLNNSGTGVGGFTITNSSATNASFGGSITGNNLAGTNTYTIGGNAGNITLTGAITNSTWTKSGSDTVILSGSGNNNAPIVVNAGTVIMAHNTSGNSNHAVQGLTINSGGAVQYGTAAQGAVGTQQVTQGSFITINSGGTLDLFGQTQNGVSGGFSVAGTGAGGNGALINSAGGSTATYDNSGSAINAAGGGSFSAGGAGNLNISAQIAGSTFGLTKVGSGTLTLSNASNSYTGATTVSAGTLTVSTTIATSTALSVAGNATFNYLPSSTGTMTLASGSTLTLGNGSTVGLAFGDEVAVAAAASVTGTANLNLSPSGLAPSFSSGTTYTLLAAGSGLPTSGGFTVVDPTNFTYTLTQSATALKITPTSVTALTTAYWLGNYSGNPGVWAASNGLASGGASNWSTNSAGTGATPLVPTSTTAVIFSATGATNQGTMQIGANMAIGSLTVNGSTAPTETNPLVLGNTGNYMLTLSSIGGVGVAINSGSGAITLNPNITLGAAQSWTNNSSSQFTVAGNVINGGNTLTVAGSGKTTISGALAGSGGVIMSGTGTLTLSNGANSYSGTNIINSGTLLATSAGALGTSTGSGNGAAVVFAGNAALDLQNNSPTNFGSSQFLYLNTASVTAKFISDVATFGNPGVNQTLGQLDVGTSNNTIEITAGSNVGSGTAGITFTAFTMQNSMTFQTDPGTQLTMGTMSNNHGVAKTGNGTMLMVGNNNFGSSIDLSAGTLAAGANSPSGNSGPFGATASVSVGDPGTTTNNSSPSVMIGGAFTVGQAININNQATTGTYTVGGNTANASTFSGSINLSQPVTLSQVAGGTVNFTGGIINNSIGNNLIKVTGAGNINVNSVIGSGSAGLTMNGTGTLTLGSTNTYTGATTVNSGTLLVNGSVNASSTVTVGGASATGTPTVGGSGTIKGPVIVSGTTTSGTIAGASGAVLTLNNGLTLAAGSNSTFNLTTAGFNNGSTGLINVTAGSFTVGSTNNITITGAVQPGYYDLFSNASSLSAALSNFNLLTTSLNGDVLSLTQSQGVNQIDLTVIVQPDFWASTSSANWDTSSINWATTSSGAASRAFSNGDNVDFSSTTATVTAVTVSSAVSPASITFLANAASYTFSGANAITLGTGGMTLGSGSGAQSFGSGVSFTLAGSQSWINNSTAVTGLTVNGNITGASSATTLTMNGSGTTTLGGLLANGSSSTLALAMSGTGTLNLNGANTYTGGTTINAGALIVGVSPGTSTGTMTLGTNSATAGAAALYLGAVGSSGGVTVGNAITVQNPSSGSNTLTLGGQNTSGTNTYGGAVTVDQSVTIFEAAGSGTLAFTGNIAPGAGSTITFFPGSGALITAGAGVIGGGSGTLAVTQNGAGTTTLSGADTYTGATTVNSGTLNVNGSLASGSAVTVGGASATGTPTLGGSGTINGFVTISGTTTPGTIAGASGAVLKLTGGLTLANSSNSTFNLIAGDFSNPTGLINVTGGTFTQASGPGSTANQVTITGAVTVNQTYQLFQSTGTLSVTNFNLLTTSLSGFSLSLTQGIDQIDLTVVAPPDYWAGTSSANWDTSSNNWSTSPSGAASNAFTNGDKVSFASSAATATAINVNSAIAPASITFLANAASYTFSGSNTITLGTAGMTVNTGSGAQSFGGGVNFALAGSQAWTNNSSAAIGLTVNGNITGASSATTLTINGSGATALGGALANGSSTLALAMSGTGTLALSGPSTYTGGTALSSGTLDLNNGSAGASTSSAIGTGALTISAGATLDATVAGITLGTHNAQNWNGTFTFTGSNSLNLGTGAVTLGANPIQLIATANTLTVGGVIGGSGDGLTKVGSGTLDLLPVSATGQSTYTGTTTLNAGTLLLDYSNLSTPTNLISGSSALSTGGGTLSVKGKSSGTTSQTFASTLVNAGMSEITVNSNGGTATNVALGSITRTGSGTGTGTGTLDITLPASGAASATAPGLNGASGATSIIVDSGGSWAAFMTVNGGASWATTSTGSNTGNIIPFPTASYTAASSNFGPPTGQAYQTHIDMLTSQSPGGGFTVGDIRFNNDGVMLTLNSGTDDIDDGGILVTPSVVNGVTISGGGILNGNGSGHKLTFFDYGKLTIASQITGSTNGVTFTGSGTTILDNSATNSWTGATTLNGGTLELTTTAGQLPGGILSTGGTSALTFSGGVLGLGSNNTTFSRGLGTGTTQVQFTGSGGFAGYFTGATVNLGGSAAGVQWNNGSFVPTGYNLILGSNSDTNTVTFANPINFNGATQVVQAVRGTATGADAILSGALTNGGLTLIGNGIVSLTSTSNTYAGSTNIIGGALLANNASNSATGTGFVTVANGGTLGGSGTITGAVTVANGGVIAPSNGGVSGAPSSVNTLTVGGLTLNSGSSSASILKYQVTSTPTFDHITDSGALTLPATSGGTPISLDFYQAGTTSPYTFGVGTYQLIGYNSVVNGNTSSLNSLFTIGTASVPGSDHATFSTTTTASNAGFLDLTISPSVSNGQYTLSVSPGATAIHVGGSTSISSTITNTGSGTQDSLYYSALGSGSSAGGSVTGATTALTSGAGLANGNTANSNSGQSFTSSTAGSYTITPSGGTVSDVTFSGTPTLISNTPATVNVYALASPTAHTPEPVAFGIVHLNATPPSQSLSITNSVVVAGYTEDLNATIGGNTGGVTSSGSFSHLVAGSSSTALSVGINTTSVGVQDGTSTITLTSAGTVGGVSNGLGTTGLGAQSVNVAGQVNYYAQPAYAQTGGFGALTHDATTDAVSGTFVNYMLNFGTQAAGSNPYTSNLSLSNAQLDMTYQDLLSGNYTIASGSGFALSGFSNFTNLAIAGSQMLSAGFATPYNVGVYNEVLNLAPSSHNSSSDTPLTTIVLTLSGTISSNSAQTAANYWSATPNNPSGPLQFGSPVDWTIASVANNTYGGIQSFVQNMQAAGSPGAGNSAGGPFLIDDGTPSHNLLYGEILSGFNSGTYTTGGGAAAVSMSWRTRTINETSFGEGGMPTAPPLQHVYAALISNVLNLNGLGTGAQASYTAPNDIGGIGANSPYFGSDTVVENQTDAFALQMNYDSALLKHEVAEAIDGGIFLAWLAPAGFQDLTAPVWQNAVTGNFDGSGNQNGFINPDIATLGEDYQGSFDSFLAAEFGGSVNSMNVTPDQLNDVLGAWGVDTTNHDVWAVVNHNSDFAVVPEPSAIVLAVIGLLGGLLVLRRRKAAVGV